MNDTDTQIKISDLLEQLQDPEPSNRVHALHQIGLRRDPVVIGSLIWLMADESLWVRCTAAETLGEFHTAEVIDPLMQFLQLGAKTELERSGFPDEMPLESHQFTRQRDPFYDTWSEVQGLTVDHRGFSLVVSARIGLQMTGILATDVMINLLDDENPYMQYVAVQVLHQMSMRKQPQDALLERLTDANPIVRVNVIRALARLGNFHVVLPLIECLQDDVIEVRIAAAQCLGKIQDKRAVAPLKAVLDNPEVHHAAWFALNMIIPGTGQLSGG